MLLGPRNSYIYNISNIMCFHRGFNVNLSNEGTGDLAFFPGVFTKKWKVLALIIKRSKFNANVHIF